MSTPCCPLGDGHDKNSPKRCIVRNDEEEEEAGSDDGFPLESVELNTIAGHVSSIGNDNHPNIMLLEEGDDNPNLDDDYEYLQGWGGGRNGTVAPQQDEQAQESSAATRSNSHVTSARSAPPTFTLTLQISCRTVPLLLIINLICALALKGYYVFFSSECRDFFNRHKPTDSYVNVTLPMGCLPPGWHRDYLTEFPRDDDNPPYYNQVYWEAYLRQRKDVRGYLRRLNVVAIVWLVSAIAALGNLGMLALKPRSSCRRHCCAKVCCCCCSFAWGLRLRILTSLGLFVWGFVDLFLHLVNIWMYGQVWWILIVILWLAAELGQMILYEAYRRHIIATCATEEQQELAEHAETANALDTPLLT